MNSLEMQPILLSLKLALVTTVILFSICLPIAWWIAFSKNSLRLLVRALVNMPFVLPPSVLGFYLLLAFSPAYPFGHFLSEAFNVRLVFSFPGIVLGSMIFSLPFMINPLITGFEALPSSFSEASYVLGKSKLRTFFSVLLPNMKSSVTTGLIMSFAHTIGEFGVVLMIGGKIPGVTRVASLAIYDEVEALNYTAANMYALVLIALSFCIVTILFIVNKKSTSLV